MSYTYSISSYTLPSARHREYPYEEPDLCYKHIRPENKNILISTMAYVPGSKPAATLLVDALTEFFDEDIVEEIISADAETLSTAVNRYISEHTGWFFRHKGITKSEYAVLVLNLDTGTFMFFTNGGIVCKGPVDSPAALCEPADCEKGIFTADTCFLIANSTAIRMMDEKPVLAEVVHKALRYLDDEYFDIVSEGFVDCRSRIMSGRDCFLAFIPVYEE